MRHCSEHTFEAVDGTPIFYRHWPAEAAASKRAILLLHRGHEHSGRLRHLVDELNLPDYEFFAFDARGHGRSPGRRGHAPGIGTLVKDLDTFVREVIVPGGTAIGNVAVIAQSVGSVIAAAWVHDYAPSVRCMILAAPAFRIKLYVPFARRGLAILRNLFGDFTVQSFVRPEHLTHDRARIATYRSDPLITRAISVSLLLDLQATADRLIEDADAIHTPTQLVVSGSDRVVRKRPQVRFFERLGSAHKEICEMKGFFHDTLGEKDRHLALGKAREFILKAFSRPQDAAVLPGATGERNTREEFEELSQPLKPFSPRAIRFQLIRAAMKTGGRLSNGIRLGLQTGFDSGATLDYVYRNQPAGVTALGTLIDRGFLNSIGWRGIRVRKQHLERLLARVIEESHAAGATVRIVDIAAGHGRYILDAVGGKMTGADYALLRDYNAQNVEQASALIAGRGLSAVAHAECANAFGGASLMAICPAPTVGVISGLFELFPDNHAVRESLSGLAVAIRPGGYLVYTGQPWHPQLELIARTLTSHRNNQPWIMRRRTQKELDSLVDAAGFRKVDQLTDEWGIFTVSLARRVAA